MKQLKFPCALSVAYKDIRILLKERGTLFYLFAVPILFILAFGGSASMDNQPKAETIQLPVVNLDAGSQASQAFLEALEQAGNLQFVPYEATMASSDLEKGKIKRVLTIPANYAADLQSGNPVTLNLVNGPDANPTTTETVHRLVTGVTQGLSLKTQLLTAFQHMADMQAGSASQDKIFTAEIIVAQAESQFERAQTEPLVSMKESWPEYLLASEETEPNPLDIYIPGFSILFIFLTAQTTAQSIYEEKKNGSFRRLLAAPISKFTILAGKMAPNFLTGLAQILVLFGAGVYIFPLLGLESMTLGKDPVALALVCLVLLLCSTSLGVLIAAIARTEGQISGLSQVVLWVFGFAAIWFNQMPSIPIFDTLSLIIPQHWANTAFLDLFIRGQGLADITPQLWVLLGFTAVFFAFGLWRFEYIES